MSPIVVINDEESRGLCVMHDESEIAIPFVSCVIHDESEMAIPFVSLPVSYITKNACMLAVSHKSLLYHISKLYYPMIFLCRIRLLPLVLAMLAAGIEIIGQLL